MHVPIHLLAQQLHVLLENARDRPNGATQKESLKKAEPAAQAAAQGDTARTIENLKKAGKWALDAATGAGTAIAEAATKQALGL